MSFAKLLIYFWNENKILFESNFSFVSFYCFYKMVPYFDKVLNTNYMHIIIIIETQTDRDRDRQTGTETDIYRMILCIMY